jgi:hypothetical protein
MRSAAGATATKIAVDAEAASGAARISIDS